MISKLSQSGTFSSGLLLGCLRPHQASHTAPYFAGISCLFYLEYFHIIWVSEQPFWRIRAQDLRSKYPQLSHIYLLKLSPSVKYSASMVYAHLRAFGSCYFGGFGFPDHLWWAFDNYFFKIKFVTIVHFCHPQEKSLPSLAHFKSSIRLSFCE